MKKEYVAPEYRSLQYVFAEEVATQDNPWGDVTENASGLLPPMP